MSPRPRLPALLCALALLTPTAGADLPEIPPVPAPVTSPQPTSTPLPRLLQTPILIVPAGDLEGVTATLNAAPAGRGRLTLSLTLQSSRATPTGLTLRRANTQNCAFAPLVRAVRVGTREVVYPGTEKRLCAQDVLTREMPPRGRLVYTRDLTLPPGEYMLEGWLSGLNGPRPGPVRVSAAPIRVSVK